MESGQAISIYDAEDNLRFANKTYSDIFLKGFDGPFTFTEILRHGARKGVGVRIDDDDVEALISRTLPRRRSVPRKAFETDFLDGRWFWIDHTVLPNGWVLTVGADITALKHSEKTLRQAHDEALLAARTDPLTGVPNRRDILDRLDKALEETRISDEGLCIAILDIDGFKALNDTYGHEVGDLALQHFTRICQERLSPEYCLGRIGGEEFLLLMPNVRPNRAIQIIDAIRTNFPVFDLPRLAPNIVCTFSAGVTESLPYDDRSSIMYRADRALYAAKRDGRNCTRLSFQVSTAAAQGQGAA
ncbi:GGDEF domain-containing protein [Microvirga rosea]|uniref:GGDEF domain-containing protein n=1 Tax=Microvirga rosea TaxID=2715425 RepID=UPI001D0A395D|nr:sensor domain-containing diguanylate cyclase [Microvirga rosea]MCB8820887.1 diguanylate cyclase [Microvirga rosea]